MNLDLLLTGMIAIPVMLEKIKRKRHETAGAIREAARVAPRSERVAMNMAADLIEEGALQGSKP